MFGMGMTELLVIFAVALLVLGPKRLPDLASGLGKAIREFRKATRDLTDQIEVDDSVRKPIMELKAALRDEPPPYEPRRTVPAGANAPAAVQERTAAAPAPSVALVDAAKLAASDEAKVEDGLAPSHAPPAAASAPASPPSVPTDPAAKV
jgi:TatA/E family protein of Tat protein translocase